MKKQNISWILALGLLLSLAFTLAARADDDRDYKEESRYGVARISLIHGDVTMMRGDTQDWVAATVNTPLVRGDRIYAGDRSRTEIQIDYANVLRLAERTEVKLADIARTRIQLQLSRGLVTYNVLRGSEADVELDTPNVAVRPLKEGIYRVEVTDSGNTIVTVRKGEAEVSTPQGNVVVKKGRQINVVGTDSVQYQIVEASHKDDWDRFNERRNDDIYEARSYRYVNRYVYGADDLDRYGRWVYVPSYGYCWYPAGAYGWVPYRYGHWTWIGYYGWTWVSYEPWGWAPYHYGRWFRHHPYGWVWFPGQRHYRPYWAPAYVSFFGFGGNGWSLGFSFGHSQIGWLPLGPGDYYRPWWGRHRVTNIVNVTNITNVTNVTNVRNVTNVNNIFADRHVRDAITTTTADDFARGRVPREQRPVDVATLRKASLVEGTPPVLPTRDIVRASDKAVSASAVPPARFTRENFFTKQKPPAGPARFDDEVASLRERLAEQGLVTAPGRKAAPRGGTVPGPHEEFGTAETPGTANRSRGRSAAGELPENPNLRSSPIGGSRPVPKQIEVPEQRPAGQEPRQGVPQSGIGTKGPMVNTPVERERESARPDQIGARPAGADAPHRQPDAKGGFRRFGDEDSPRTGAASREFDREKDKPKPSPDASGPRPQSNRRESDKSAQPQSSPRQAEPVRPGWQRFGGGKPARSDQIGAGQEGSRLPGREVQPGVSRGRESGQPATPQSGTGQPESGSPGREKFERFYQELQSRPEPPRQQEGGPATRTLSTPERPRQRGEAEPSQPGFQRFEPQPRGEVRRESVERRREEFRSPQSNQGERDREAGRPSVPDAPRRFENPPERPRSFEPSRPEGMERRPEASREPPRQIERRPLEIHKPVTVERPSRQAPPRSERQAGRQRSPQGKPEGHKPDRWR